MPVFKPVRAPDFRDVRRALSASDAAVNSGLSQSANAISNYVERRKREAEDRARGYIAQFDTPEKVEEAKLADLFSAERIRDVTGGNRTTLPTSFLDQEVTNNLTENRLEDLNARKYTNQINAEDDRQKAIELTSQLNNAKSPEELQKVKEDAALLGFNDPTLAKTTITAFDENTYQSNIRNQNRADAANERNSTKVMSSILNNRGTDTDTQLINKYKNSTAYKALNGVQKPSALSGFVNLLNGAGLTNKQEGILNSRRTVLEQNVASAMARAGITQSQLDISQQDVVEVLSTDYKGEGILGNFKFNFNSENGMRLRREIQAIMDTGLVAPYQIIDAIRIHGQLEGEQGFGETGINMNSLLDRLEQVQIQNARSGAISNFNNATSKLNQFNADESAYRSGQLSIDSIPASQQGQNNRDTNGNQASNREVAESLKSDTPINTDKGGRRNGPGDSFNADLLQQQINNNSSANKALKALKAKYPNAPEEDLIKHQELQKIYKGSKRPRTDDEITAGAPRPDLLPRVAFNNFEKELQNRENQIRNEESLREQDNQKREAKTAKHIKEVDNPSIFGQGLKFIQNQIQDKGTGIQRFVNSNLDDLQEKFREGGLFIREANNRIEQEQSTELRKLAGYLLEPGQPNMTRTVARKILDNKSWFAPDLLRAAQDYLNKTER